MQISFAGWNLRIYRHNTVERKLFVTDADVVAVMSKFQFHWKRIGYQVLFGELSKSKIPPLMIFVFAIAFFLGDPLTKYPNQSLAEVIYRTACFGVMILTAVIFLMRIYATLYYFRRREDLRSLRYQNNQP